MIVLDAANKSLIVSRPQITNGSAVVSYWSIVSSVWTPHTFEVIFPFVNVPTNADTIILPTPIAGESRVVENVWIHLVDDIPAGNPPGVMKILMDVGGIQHNLAMFEGANNFTGGTVGLKGGSTITLGRDGSFTRQTSQFKLSPNGAPPVEILEQRVH